MTVVFALLGWALVAYWIWTVCRASAQADRAVERDARRARLQERGAVSELRPRTGHVENVTQLRPATVTPIASRRRDPGCDGPDQGAAG